MVSRAELSSMSTALTELAERITTSADAMLGGPNEGVAVDLDERPRLQNDLGGKNIMLLRNHGTLALGATVAEAFMRIYFIERACAMQVATLSSSGGAFYPTEESVQDKVAEQGRDEEIARQGANLLAWPALLRRLDRLDPSYKK